MSVKKTNVPRLIATRYVRLGKRSHLVSFMSLVSVLGLALGVAILIIVLSVMNGFDKEMRENVLSIVPHVTVSTEENLSANDWQQIAETIASHPDIEDVAPVIDVAGVVATPRGNKAVLVNGIEFENAQSTLSRFIKQGSIEALANTRWGIVLGESLAERLQVSVGQRVDLFSPTISLNPVTPLATFKSFEVVGIFKVGSIELDGELAVVNLEAARTLFRLRSPYNGLRISTTDVLAADQIRFDLISSLPNYMNAESWTASLGSIYNNIKFSRSIIGLLLWLLVGVAAFNLVVSLIMIVRDKRSDIAILRTLGASPGMINRIFIWQGSLIGALGIGIGVVLGILGSYQISNLAAAVEDYFSIQLLNAEVYPIDFLPSELNYLDVATVVFGVMLLSILATIYPAKRAAAVQPAAALRND